MQCARCRAFFANRMQLGPHMRVCPAHPLIEEPDTDWIEPAGTAVPIPAVPAGSSQLISLAQRPADTIWNGDNVVTSPTGQMFPPGRAYRDLRELQAMWKGHVNDVRKCCDAQFWEAMSPVKEESAATRDKVLSMVKKLLNKPRNWPQSTRSLCNKVKRKIGLFWPNVTETHVIDLRQFGIRSCPSVTFSFTDPLFVWTQCCNALEASGYTLHWKPKVLLHPQTQLPAYGSGVQYGLLLRSAAASVPRGGRPALISLSWDGGNTGYGSRSTEPICIQVMNVNTASQDGVGLLGYMPHVQVPDALTQHKNVLDARWYVKQKVVGLLLQSIEECAREGIYVV